MGDLMSRCVLCNKPVKEGTEMKAKYVIHKRCYEINVPSAALARVSKWKRLLDEQKVGDEPV